MKVIVPVKRVIDFAARIQIKADHTGVETSQVKMSMNPFDEIAVEEAVRLKEKGIVTEILLVTIGTQSSQETLRTGLAMGADRALLIETDQSIEPLAAAKILKWVVEQENPQVVILGKQAIDTDNNQTGQMLAGLLNWPQGTFASKLEFKDNAVEVTREVDGGLETLKLTLPAVITTDLRLNEPRYLSLPNIVQAKRKPITVTKISDLPGDYNPRLEILTVTPPEKRSSGKKVSTAKELVEKLKTEAQVI